MSDELLTRLPEYLGGHVLLSVAAMVVGLLVSLPLGVLASRRPRLAEVLLGGAGILQTVPSLALLVIMVPLLGVIGFAPAFVALSVYSILPILANTVIGIRGIDPVLIEAAQGLGMTNRQMLWRVQLPLALPVIVAGIRTATVMTVGTATLATPVGGLSLGNYIFSGLESNDMRSTVFGCVCTALLAVVMDQLVRLLEVAARRRSRRLALIGASALLLVLAAALYRPVTHWFEPPAPVIASANFTEQSILSEVMREKLQAAGYRVDQRYSVGYMVEYLGLKHSQIDCSINYTGDIWSTLMKRRDIADRQTTYEQVRRFLKEQYGVTCLGKVGFENAYALAMRRTHADRLKIHNISDLAKHASGFSIAADMAFFERHEWGNVRERYGLKFKEHRPMDSSLMYAAAAEGAVDVICAYTTDGRIIEKDLVILDDPLQAFPPYDAILLLSAKAAADPRLVEALRPLVQSIDVEQMRRANLRVDVEGRSPREVARELMERTAGKREEQRR